mgnify:CR=1 FL=1|tara:strand:+ start:1215 stop:2306 length:1092 start_codon:yes stop_codon:yes gene_type:complete
MSLPPVEIPLGAMRFNSDSQKLEYWNGEIWMQVHTFSPDLDGGARGVFGGSYSYGVSPSNYPKTNIIDYITIATAGNAIDFGDLTEIRGPGGAGSSSTRGLFCGGNINPNAAKTSVTVDYVTISSTGNAVDYGDLTVKGGHGIATMSNQTRLVCAGRNTQDPSSYPGADVNTIDYTTIASTGNFKDFGDLVDAAGASAPIYGVSGCSNGIRGIISGGDEGPAYDQTMKFITIPTLGNSTDFGEATVSKSGPGACSSSTRGLIGGGSGPNPSQNVIDSIQIASTGNAVKFGELNFSTQARFPGCTSNCIRGIWAGGYGPAPTYTVSNPIDYVSIATEGNAVDFGDLVAAAAHHQGFSNGHGGLG